MPMKDATQWRLRVIAVWPMAPKGDDMGFLAHKAAQESLKRPSVITACLRAGSEHSYISRDLVRYLMGEEGLQLAESASHQSQLGQIGAILSCEQSRNNLTENFLLSDLQATEDLLLSPYSWKSLEMQCDDEAFCSSSRATIATRTPRRGSDGIRRKQQNRHHHHHFCPPNGYHHETFQLSGSLDDPFSEGSESLADAESEESSVRTPCSMLETTLLTTAPTYSSPPGTCGVLFEDRNCTDKIDHLCDLLASERGGTLEDSLYAQHDRCAREVAYQQQQHHHHHPGWVNKVVVDNPKSLCDRPWAWNAEKQNYFCPDRDEDDAWYWYPNKIV